MGAEIWGWGDGAVSRAAMRWRNQINLGKGLSSFLVLIFLKDVSLLMFFEDAQTYGVRPLRLMPITPALGMVSRGVFLQSPSIAVIFSDNSAGISSSLWISSSR